MVYYVRNHQGICSEYRLLNLIRKGGEVADDYLFESGSTLAISFGEDWTVEITARYDADEHYYYAATSEDVRDICHNGEPVEIDDEQTYNEIVDIITKSIYE